MQLQDIGKLLGLQGVRVIDLTHETNENGGIALVQVEAINSKQKCPCCKSEDTIKNGKDGYRQVTHLKIADTQCIIQMPRQRLKCKECGATYAYEYTFVVGKERYTKAYKAQIYKISIGATVQHGAAVTETPYSTAERFFKEAALRIAPLTSAAAQSAAEQAALLILGIDDFAIRKGHNYNTGIHDLRGESLLGIVEGRTMNELCDYMDNNPQMAALKPHAVVMDLAKNYHAFIAKFFPDAIRVADRFHVNGYIMDALNEIRRRVSKDLPSQARMDLKRNKHLLNKRNDSLCETERLHLIRLLTYATDLREVYELKELLIDWYDLSNNFESAKICYHRWLSKGHSLNIPEVEIALKTFENWRDEIVNYHRCRFTNGIVEGRNGKIKSLQRRRFFLRNRTFYEALIIIECNHDLAHRQFMSFSA